MIFSQPDVPVLTEDTSQVAHPEEDGSRSVPALTEKPERVLKISSLQLWVRK